MKQAIKRLLRPLIPDSLMARYRLAQHSREVRINIDLFIDEPRLAKRWLRVTPDTVRVRTTPVQSEVEGVVVIRCGETTADPARYLDDPVEVVIVGRMGPPHLVRGRRKLPAIDPIAIAARSDVFEEVGGRPADDADLRALMRRLMDAGRFIGMVPEAGDASEGHRRDRIDRPSVVIMSAVPLHDVGGGSRTAQLALEFARRGFHVTYVSVFGAAESVDLGLRYIHPALEQVSIHDFEPTAFVARVRCPALCLVALPAEPLLDVARSLQEAGFRLVYDLIDDWSDVALGGEWYRPSVERAIVSMADLLVGSASDLVDRLRSMAGREPVLVENAVNADVFGSDPGPRPADLPAGSGPLLGYHGSLYGDWFDWDSLRRLAVARSKAVLVVIGDPPARAVDLPPNVHLLGLKRQIDLPAYVGRFDVGLLPFVVSETTHAVSPLKVYEYLAMGVPVAAPPLRSLEGLAGVHTSNDLVDAVSAALAGPGPDRRHALAEHSWSRRVEHLLVAAGVDDADQGAPVLVLSRPVVHHPEAERLLV